MAKTGNKAPTENSNPNGKIRSSDGGYVTCKCGLTRRQGLLGKLKCVTCPSNPKRLKNK